MESARKAVSNFISKDGHHKTTVDEDINSAVTNEHVRKHQHEEVTTAVDKEVHQDHHHTTIQPIKDREVLPEQHHHNVVPVEHKTFVHGDDKETKERLDHEHDKFKNTSTTHDTTHTQTIGAAVTGERVHHHVHEHIQPVVHKDVIQDHVVHTTVPVHETHHAKPIHHSATTLPVKTLDEFTREKGGLSATQPRHLKHDEFDGCPDKMSKQFAAHEHTGVAPPHPAGHTHPAGHATGAGTAAVGTAALGTTAASHHKDSLAAAQTADARHTNDANYTTGSTGKSSMLPSGAAANSSMAQPRISTTSSHDGASMTKKASLVDKLNPFKDADGDGKKGIMS